MNTYFNPVHTFQGFGCLEQLPSLAASTAIPGKNILLLVWDEGVLTQPGIRDLQNFEKGRVITRVFSASNPELGQLWQVYVETRELDIGLVVAVGGGSVLDVGKSLCCLYGKPLSSEEDLRKMIAAKAYGTPSCRWIGVPTTAGTGSEVTCWATIWDSQNGVKYSVDTSENYAFAAVVDPQLAATMPHWMRWHTPRRATGPTRQSRYPVGWHWKRFEPLWDISTNWWQTVAVRKHTTRWQRGACWQALLSAIPGPPPVTPFPIP